MKLISDLDEIGKIETQAYQEDTPELWEQAFYSLKAYSDLHPDNLECSLRLVFFCWFLRLEYEATHCHVPSESELEITMKIAYERANQHKEKNFYDYLWIVGFVLAMGPYMLDGQGDDVGEDMLKQATEIEPNNPIAWFLLAGFQNRKQYKNFIPKEKLVNFLKNIDKDIETCFPETRGRISGYFYMMLSGLVEDFK